MSQKHGGRCPQTSPNNVDLERKLDDVLRGGTSKGDVAERLNQRARQAEPLKKGAKDKEQKQKTLSRRAFVFGAVGAGISLCAAGCTNASKDAALFLGRWRCDKGVIRNGEWRSDEGLVIDIRWKYELDQEKVEDSDIVLLAAHGKKVKTSEVLMAVNRKAIYRRYTNDKGEDISIKFVLDERDPTRGTYTWTRSNSQNPLEITATFTKIRGQNFVEKTKDMWDKLGTSQKLVLTALGIPVVVGVWFIGRSLAHDARDSFREWRDRVRAEKEIGKARNLFLRGEKRLLKNSPEEAVALWKEAGRIYVKHVELLDTEELLNAGEVGRQLTHHGFKREGEEILTEVWKRKEFMRMDRYESAPSKPEEPPMDDSLTGG